MTSVIINGYRGYIANSFFLKYKKKYNVTHFKKDINDIDSLKSFIKKTKVTHFIHFAGFSRVNCLNNKINCLKTNYQSVKSIIKYFNTLKHKPQFIFISSCHVYRSSKKKLKENSFKKPTDLYGQLKLKSENYIKNNYKNHCILRLFNVYGKNQPSGIFLTDIVNKLKNNQKIIINNSIRDFIHVNDVIKVISFMIKNNVKSTINVGSGIEYKLSDVVNKIADKLNISKTLIKIKNKSDKIVADISLLKNLGYKSKNNEKYINF